MKRDLEKLLAEIGLDKGPRVLLLYGDDYRVREASHAILDVVVPAENRAFNLESFDGRSAGWDKIEAALMTPPFFPGRKLVWIENAPYFLARGHKGEVGERILQLWDEGKKEEAARLFLNLLVSEGWTQEMWEELRGPAALARMGELIGAQEKEVEEILAFCRNSEMELRDRGETQGDQLTELVERGLPTWGFLLITAPQVDRRSRLYRKFEEKAAVVDLGLERDRSGRIQRESLADFVDRRLREADKKVEAQAREAILQRAGDQLWTVHEELEKLLLYVGENPWIRLADVEEIFSDLGEAWVFGLTESIAKRDPLSALNHLARLLSQGDHPLKLLGTIATELRRLLGARQLIEGEMRDRWNKEMNFPQFQRSVLQHGPPLLTRNPYADYMAFQRATGFTMEELLRYVGRLSEADLQLKSSGHSSRIVLERLVLEMSQPLPVKQNEN